MNLEKLLIDHRIPFAPPGDKNYREGWYNIQCPFCGDHSYHLGIAETGASNCWRCGTKSFTKVLARRLGISESKAHAIAKEYGGSGAKKKVKQVKRKIRTKAHKLPTDTGPMKPRHKRYLIKRNFDPDYIAAEWGVLGTGPISKLDKINYSHRILAPIMWDRQQVSFQTRDITDRHKVKYMACPEERELAKHKHLLYGKQEEWDQVGIGVEGITDVWRLGPKAVCTFGIEFTRQQARLISKNFERFIIMYDEEPQAQKQAELLEAELLLRGTDVKRITMSQDPASLSEQAAKELLKKIY